MGKQEGSNPRAPRRHARLARLSLGLLALTALLGPAATGQTPAAPPTDRAFEGSWSATGTRQVLTMGGGRKAGILYLSGSLMLSSQEGLSLGFRCEAIGFDDGMDISAGEAVWTDDQGDKIFSDVKGEAVSTGKHIVGTIIGGTGRYTGITGEYEFDWQYVIQAPDGVIQGRAGHLEGHYHFTAPPAAPAPADKPR